MSIVEKTTGQTQTVVSRSRNLQKSGETSAYATKQAKPSHIEPDSANLGQRGWFAFTCPTVYRKLQKTLNLIGLAF